MKNEENSDLNVSYDHFDKGGNKWFISRRHIVHLALK